MAKTGVCEGFRRLQSTHSTYLLVAPSIKHEGNYNLGSRGIIQLHMYKQRPGRRNWSFGIGSKAMGYITFAVQRSPHSVIP